MEEESTFGFSSERSQVIARLATLQRLKEEASKNNRTAMLANIEKMIEAESGLLRRLYDRDSQAEAV